jgi:hypothetical protein
MIAIISLATLILFLLWLGPIQISEDLKPMVRNVSGFMLMILSFGSVPALCCYLLFFCKSNLETPLLQFLNGENCVKKEPSQLPRNFLLAQKLIRVSSRRASIQLIVCVISAPILMYLSYEIFQETELKFTELSHWFALKLLALGTSISLFVMAIYGGSISWKFCCLHRKLHRQLGSTIGASDLYPVDSNVGDLKTFDLA